MNKSSFACDAAVDSELQQEIKRNRQDDQIGNPEGNEAVIVEEKEHFSKFMDAVEERKKGKQPEIFRESILTDPFGINKYDYP